MVKTMKISEEQLYNLEFANTYSDMKTVIQNIVGINSCKEYLIGKVGVKIKNAKPLEVYKNTNNNKNYFYIVIRIFDEESAYAYILYENNK